jgi:hypothetical protein
MIRILLPVLLMSTAAFGGIAWQQDTIRLKAHPAQVATEAVFHFSNTGDEAVSIDDVIVTCGCMNAKPTQPSYAPGEAGSLRIMMDLRNREGKLHKTLRVKTSNGRERVLTVKVDIPSAYLIDTRIISWAKGDASKEKTIRLTNPNTMPIALRSITSSHDGLSAELKAVREGFEYTVVVRRTTEERLLRSVIRIALEPPPGETNAKTINLYAVVP